jgi:hypothetical protein
MDLSATAILYSPVVLPLGERVIPTIFAASMGVAVPYLFFLLAMLQLLHETWSSNVSPREECCDAAVCCEKENPGYYVYQIPQFRFPYNWPY